MFFIVLYNSYGGNSMIPLDRWIKDGYPKTEEQWCDTVSRRTVEEVSEKFGGFVGA